MRFGLGWITANWGLKLISLILALGFWFYVVGEESVEVTKTVSLEILPPNQKISVVKTSALYLEVTLQSPRHLFSALSTANITAKHKIQNVDKPGEYSFNISSDDIILPTSEIRVVKIFPSFVTVILDEVIVKKLPVKVEFMGDPAFGYRVDDQSIDLDPNAVLVEAPKALLEKMDVIKTEPIQLVGRVRSFRRTVRVQRTSDMKVIGDGITEVQIPIIAEFTEKELKSVPIRSLGKPSNEYYVKLAQNEIPIIVKGPRAILDNVAAADIVAYIEVDDLDEGLHEIPVKLILPDELILKGDPPIISIEVKKL